MPKEKIKTLRWLKPLWWYSLLDIIGLRVRKIGRLYMKGKYYDHYKNERTGKLYLKDKLTGCIAEITYASH